MKWCNLLNTTMGTKLDQATVNQWEAELRGLRVDSEELCQAIRYISDMEPTPRADPKRMGASYNLADIKKWVRMYRQASKPGIFDTAVFIKGITPFSKRVKIHINDLISDGKHSEAKECAEKPFIYLHRFEGQPDYTPEEREDVMEFLRGRLV